jgi:hypothetical protein
MKKKKNHLFSHTNTEHIKEKRPPIYIYMFLLFFTFFDLRPFQPMSSTYNSLVRYPTAEIIPNNVKKSSSPLIFSSFFSFSEKENQRRTSLIRNISGSARLVHYFYCWISNNPGVYVWMRFFRSSNSLLTPTPFYELIINSFVPVCGCGSKWRENVQGLILTPNTPILKTAKTLCDSLFFFAK